MAVRVRLHNSASLIPKKEPSYLWVGESLGSGIELNAVVVGNVITAVTTVAANRTSAARHNVFFIPPHYELTSLSGHRKVRWCYITKIRKIISH
jgi:hypothetical protein